MKFSDGYWVNKKGYTVHYIKQAYAIEYDEYSIKILATPRMITDRGMTLEGPNLEITLSSRAKDVIKAEIVHHKGALDFSPKFELNEDFGYRPVIKDGEDTCEMISGNTRVVVSKKSWWVQYYYKDKRLTCIDGRATSYITKEKPCDEIGLAPKGYFWSYPSDRDCAYSREQLSLSVGECIYGFGEKFTPFVKNGQTIEMWNSDGGTCTEQSYKCIPFYVSSKGFGVFVNSTDKVSFEVGSDTVSKVSFTVSGERLEYFLIGGENLSDVISNYTSLTGKPALPPAYSFGLWLSTSFTTRYDEETVTGFIDGMKRRNIPLQVFHFDCFWMKEYEWTSFEWDRRLFPDPQRMLKELKDRGLRISCWINPYIAQRSALFDEGMKNGYFIRNLDGSVFQCDYWQPSMAIVDFTNPQACKWFGDKIKTLCKTGVDCIKTDFGERLPAKALYYNGEDSVKMHNYYTYLYNKTVFEAIQEIYGKNRVCLFSRSATAGGQKFPVHWGGDCSADYASMAETLRGGLSLSLSGFGYFSHDISGFEATATPDIYKRWCAFGLLSSHSRLHGNSSYRVPWLFDEESCDVLRFFTNLKGRLMPYLYAQAVKTSVSGVPMMRAMVLDFSNEPSALYCDRQYMLGENLLIAPVMNEDGFAEFYIPEGIWTDLITGETVRGGKYFSRKCAYTEIPAYVKPNSIIAFGDFKGDFEYDYLQDAEFVIYCLEDGKTASACVYDTCGNKVLTICAKRAGDKILIGHDKTDKKFSVKVANTDICVKSGAGESFEIMLTEV